MSDCERYGEWMVDRLDGELDAARAAELEAHVAACKACREKMESYDAIQAAYRELPEEELTPGLESRVLEVARDAVERRSWIQRPTGWLLAAAAAAVLVFGLGRAWLVGGTETHPAIEQIERGDRLLAEGKRLRARRAWQEALGELNASLGGQLSPERREQELRWKGEVLEKLEEYDDALDAYRALALTASDAELDLKIRELEALPRNSAGVRVQPLDAELLEQLQALGYAE